MNLSEKSSIMVYGFGGCGTNVVLSHTNVPNDPERFWYGEVDTCVIDSSKSNLHASKDVASTHLAGEDGMGKSREEAYKAFNGKEDTVLKDHPPADFNIIVTSAGGGTGNIMASLIMRKLDERGIPFVCILIGDTEYLKSCKNTLATIATLENQAADEDTNGPINIIYLENSSVTDEYRGHRTDINVRVEVIIQQLSLLFSGKHYELDKKDIKRWLNYTTNNPDEETRLMEVLILKEKDGVDLTAHANNVRTMVSLLASEDSNVPELNAIDGTVGFYNEDVTKDKLVPSQHFITTSAHIDTIVTNLDKRCATLEQVKADMAEGDREAATRRSTNKAKAGKGGIIF